MQIGQDAKQPGAQLLDIIYS
ncbi:unnamed protein product [Linum tenue]|uniref:Uncharacterized protein n=1 Tax=Linum tenue TaxID=586396 RepID=A0AAV0J4J5_9ROSI|nr:unnamed protein product [Linum tenue]